MKRRLRQSYRLSAAQLREQRRLARRSAALSLLLLGGLALGAALWTLPARFFQGTFGGSFEGIAVSEPQAAAETELPMDLPPTDSPVPDIDALELPPPELLPVETSPPELAVDELPEPTTASPMDELTASLAFQLPQRPEPKPAARPVAAPAAPAARPAAASSAPAGKAGGTLVAASYRRAPSPPYPAALRSSRIEGRVGVRISIDAEGKPTRVDITAPSGHAEFDSTARSWILENWRFHPATRDGVAIASAVTTRVEFVLR